METVNQDNKNTAEEPERTFTQSEMDAIIKDRLRREHEKYADYDALKDKATKFDAQEEASKSDLQKATERADALQAQLDQMLKADGIRKVREKVAQQTGVPALLLSGETEEICAEQAKAILEFAKPAYPNVKDGGEIHQKIGGEKTRDQFKDWFENMTAK